MTRRRLRDSGSKNSAGTGLTPRRHRRRRPARVLLVIVAALLVLVALPAAALASAGGGSAGFSDGGGSSFGGGGGGGGKGFIIIVAIRLLIDLALFGHGTGLLIIAVVAAAAYLYMVVWPKLRANMHARAERGRAQSRKTQKRQRRVELAAAEAADENDLFDPEHVRAAAANLFERIQMAWDADDRSTLHSLLTPRLATEWERRLDDMQRRGWRNHVEIQGEPKVEYVGIERRNESSPEDGTDRVVVRIEAKLKDYVVDRSGRHIKREGAFTETIKLREFWTLERRNDRWMLTSIEQGAEGEHQLSDKIVQTEWADSESLHDEAMVEAAAADKPPTGTQLAELAPVDLSSDAHAAANDLSLVDGRFAPDILTIAARHAVAAWADAIDGSPLKLESLATPDAVTAMLHPGDTSRRTRLVVRGPKVERIGIVALDPAATPATMTIDVTINGRRYIQDRDTTQVVSGSTTRATTFTDRWTLALTDNDRSPWQITAVGSAHPAGTGAH
jgi:predicted lipid-binding transport protein (Tim44 family)